MNLIIFHGDNSVVLSKKLSELKARFDSDAISSLSLKTSSFEQLLIETRTPSLFANQRLVIVADADEKKVSLDTLTQDTSLTLVLCFSRELSASSKLLQQAYQKKVAIFALSQPQDKSVFQFLDLVADKNAKALGELEPLYNHFGGQYLLTMLLYLFRRLVMPAKNATFQAAKADRQKENFSEQKIADCYLQILKTDFLIKSGKADEKTGLLLLVQRLIT